MTGAGEHPRKVHPLVEFFMQEMAEAIAPVLKEIAKQIDKLAGAVKDFPEAEERRKPPTHVGPLTKPRPPKMIMRAGYTITPRRRGFRHREHQYKRPTKMRL